ncbi:MAG: 30S ribosomal protein S1, partial [Deltaproteobacteria bacterium]
MEGTEVNIDELREMYEKAFKEVAEGEIVKGKVIEVGREFVTVDVGCKSEGQVPLSEFFGPDGEVTVKAGDEVEVLLERRRDDEGEVILSKVKADRIRVWERIMEACQRG